MALLILLGACGDEATGPDPAELEVVVVSGSGAFGVVGQELRFEAVVRQRSDGVPQSGVSVTWTIDSGDASILPDGGSVSDDDGLVWAVVRLGSTPGPVVVRVTVTGTGGATAVLSATVAAHPRLDAVAPASALPGGTIRLTGAGFSARSEDDVVLFSGIRGEVTAASDSVLQVVVPPCLPARDVDVTVQLGTLVSEASSLALTAPGSPTAGLDPGGWLEVEDPSAPSCLGLSGGHRYLVLASSSSTVAGGRYSTTLRGLTPAPMAALRTNGARGSEGPMDVGQGQVAGADPERFGAGWETALRIREARLTAGAVATRTGVPERAAEAPLAAPQVGDRRTFRVLNRDQELEEVTAVVRRVGEEVVLYVDETAPAGGFSDDDLALFAHRFDDVIHPAVTRAFGDESDLDGNGRIVILFTPVVNRLTPRGSDGLVGGFFFGLDLLEGQGGNDGEVFYAMVPDPEGIHSDPRTTERVLEAVPAVLAHEFEHMIQFNQRVLLRDAQGIGALWLSEAMAQMAEEEVARAYEERGEPDHAELFRDGNRHRARLYLQDPTDVSLIVVSGSGSLTERGGGWLLVLYLADRWGDSVLQRLVGTTRTGVDNVVSVTGTGWATLLQDWWSALYLDGPTGDGESYATEYPSVDLRRLVGRPGEAYPLVPRVRGAGDFLESDSLWSASAAYYIVEAPPTGSTVLRLAGPDGAPVAAGSELRLRIVRLF
jgi:hypothetical protein